MTKLLFLRKLYNISNRVQTIIYPSWNLLKFKIKGVNLGKNLNVYTKMFLEIGNGANVTIGDNFIFSSDNCINPLCRNIRGCIVAYPNSSIIIGKNVGMSSPCIWARSSIKIGNNVKIGGDCIIIKIKCENRS